VFLLLAALWPAIVLLLRVRVRSAAIAPCVSSYRPTSIAWLRGLASGCVPWCFSVCDSLVRSMPCRLTRLVLVRLHRWILVVLCVIRLCSAIRFCSAIPPIYVISHPSMDSPIRCNLSNVTSMKAAASAFRPSASMKCYLSIRYMSHKREAVQSSCDA
jgi:hypothetical protein